MSELIKKIEVRHCHPYIVYDSILSTPNILKGILETKKYVAMIETVAKEVINRGIQRIYFSGCGTSYYAGIASTYIFHKLTKIPTVAITAFELINYPPPDMNSNVALFVISHSGHTKVDVDLAKYAKEKGVFTVAITDVPDSPLARSVDKVILGPGGRDIPIPKTRSYVASLLRSFLVAIYIGKETNINVDRYLNEVRQIPDLISKIIKNSEEKVKELASKYRDKYSFFIVGGGPNYATALEGALKLKEMGFVDGEAIEAEEAAHGPHICFNENIVYMTIAPPSLCYNRLYDLVRSVKVIGAPTISIVQEGDDRISKVSDDFIEIPATLSEELTPMLYIIPIYLFSYYLAVEKGMNPDIARTDDIRFRKVMEILFPPGTH